ncbi:MAG: cytochrome b N-terminal domain-containing protein [Bacteroidales bacterium]|nr:cytochrome b N-terminal domain-containing protein [Bacteroidales bacterium]
MHDTNSTIKKKIPCFGFILHLHPRKVNPSVLRFHLTFGLGGMAALLVAVQAVTGLLLKFHYVPTPQGAYNSILNLQETLLFGKMLRSIHHWGAILLIWVVFLHLLRVVFTGAYRKPRHSNWHIGLLLFILVVFSNFTGYLLPWDQLSYWAITISTNLIGFIPFGGSWLKEVLLGGTEVGRATLTKFYNLHTGIIPFSMLILMAYHFWHVRKAGGVVVAEEFKYLDNIDTNPHLVAREFVVALVLLAVLFFLGSVFDAPLRDRANPAMSPDPAKAPWYFMGLQELLIHFHPFIVVVFFPLVLLFAALGLPYFIKKDKLYGIWFISSNGKKAAVYAMFFGILITLFFILADEFLPGPEIVAPNLPTWITSGVLPLTVSLIAVYSFLRYLKKKYLLNRAGIVQTFIVFLVAAYSILTITGIFFRGKGMSLVWPW